MNSHTAPAEKRKRKQDAHDRRRRHPRAAFTSVTPHHESPDTEIGGDDQADAEMTIASEETGIFFDLIKKPDTQQILRRFFQNARFRQTSDQDSGGPPMSGGSDP